MALRDLFMVSGLLALIPMIIVRPHVGAMLWAWTAMLVPNTFLYGFGQSLRYNLIIAAVTLLAWLISREPKRIHLSATNLLLFLFLLWVCLATASGVSQEEVRWREVENLIKVMLFMTVVSGLMTTRLRIYTLLYGLCFGMAFHGAAEGTKFLVTGGSHRVWGPGTSVISDNNHFALAMIFVMPIVYYLFSYAANTLVRFALLGTLALVFASVIGTFSRGGLIAILAVGVFWLLRSNSKITILCALALGGSAVVMLAPEHWFARMSTLSGGVQEDNSFMLRIIAWKVSTLLAIEDPVFGGGMYAVQDPTTWFRFTNSSQFGLFDFIPTPPPDPYIERAAHSIYFQVLGDAGFVGLAIFIAVLARAWFCCGRLVRKTKDIVELEWIQNLARAFQVSLVAYGVAGAAINMAYFEMLYILVVLIALLENQVRQYDDTRASERLPGPAARPEASAPGHVGTVNGRGVRPMKRRFPPRAKQPGNTTP